MKIRNMRLIGATCFALALVSCGGEDASQKTIVADDECKALDGASYVTTTLGEGGLTMNGVVLSHWSARFFDGKVNFSQSDFIFSGTYTCEEGEVSVAVGDLAEQTLTFTGDFESFSFAPLGGEAKTYVRQASSESSYEACRLIRGKRFTEFSRESNTVDDEETFTFGNNYYEFSDTQQVTYTIGGDAVVTGIYDCSTGEIHIHIDQDDNDPSIVTVVKEGKSIEVDNGESTREFVLDDGGPIACTEEFAPVCAIKPEDIQCVTTPCPEGVYKTYSNRCFAESEEAEVAFEGECGAQEGQLYAPPIACTTQYDPVCGTTLTQEPCLTVPCPAVLHKTYGNDCEADAAKATSLFDGECGDLEGTPVDSTSGICSREYDPVCGKIRTNIVCVTTPCDTHEYKTFGNQCVADFALANVVYHDECGDLEGPVSYGEPPVVLTTDFPQSDKVTNVSDVAINGDVLSVTLAYSGCDQQHFEMFAGKYVLESFPPQIEIAFKPLVEDECEAVFTSELRYDLLPLKVFLDDGDPQTTQEFILRGLGLSYIF